MTPQEELYLSTRAKEVIENEAYIQAFDYVRNEAERQWRESPAMDTNGRERLWLIQKLLIKIKLCLDATMDGGKLAKAELAHRQTMLDRAKETLSGRDKDAW